MKHRNKKKPEILKNDAADKKKAYSLTLNRRQLLKRLAVGGLFLTGGVALYHFLRSYNTARLTETTQNEIYFFLEYKPDLSIPSSFEQVKRLYVPLSSRDIAAPSTVDYSEAKEKIIEWIEKAVDKNVIQTEEGEYDFKIWRYVYGVPSGARIAESLLAHCKRAVEFLYNTLKGLDWYDIDWTIIHSGDNFEHQFHQKGFVGDNYYMIYEAEVEHKKSGKHLPTPLFIAPAGGGFYGRKYNEATKKWLWHIFISAGKSAIVSPFSEVIPLTTSKASDRLEKDVGSYLARVAEETISESLSYHVAKLMIQEFNIPIGEKYLEDMHRNLHERDDAYRFVPHARKWIEAYGIQKAFDLYMEDPNRFMNTVTSNSSLNSSYKFSQMTYPSRV